MNSLFFLFVVLMKKLRSFFQIVSLKNRLFFINNLKDAQHFVNIIGNRRSKKIKTGHKRKQA